jgi:hypothetical protein
MIRNWGLCFETVVVPISIWAGRLQNPKSGSPLYQTEFATKWGLKIHKELRTALILDFADTCSFVVVGDKMGMWVLAETKISVVEGAGGIDDWEDGGRVRGAFGKSADDGLR